MSLLAPGWLVLGALIGLVLVLHMRRRRQLDVPSTLLWRLLENTVAPRRALRRPQPSLLLFLQIAVVALVAIALAQPILSGGQSGAQHTIYVLDASASMRATDQAPSRFDAALARLAGLIESDTIGTGARVALITAGPEARLQVARQADAAGILPIVQGLRAGDGNADWRGAAILLKSLVRADEAAAVVVVTDGADAGIAEIARAFPSVAVRRALVSGNDFSNVGLTARFSPINAETGEWRVEGTVRFSGPTPDAATIEVMFQPAGLDGFVELTTTNVTRVGNDTTFSSEMRVPGAGVVRLRLANDAGPHDNTVHFAVRREPVKARVLYLGAPSVPLLAALQSIHYVEVVAADALPPDDQTFDLVVVDGMTLQRRPKTNTLWVGAAHVASLSPPIPLRDPYVTGWERDHPLAEQVDWTAISPELGFRVPRLPGATVLAESGGLPLVQARTTPFGREVQLAFLIDDTGWSDRSSFPVFVTNFVRWLSVEIGAVSEPNCQVGVLCPLPSRFLGARIVSPDGAERTLISTAGVDFLVPGMERGFAPERAGIYRVVTPDETRLITVAAATTGETSLAAFEDTATDEVGAGSSLRVWWWLLAAALVILLVETWISGRGTEQYLRPEALSSSRALSSRRRLLLGLRVAGIAVLVGALSGMPLPARVPAEELVVVVGTDFGNDKRNVDRDRLLAEIGARLADRGDDANAGVVVAGTPPRVAVDIGAGGEWREDPFRSVAAGTNLERATNLASAMLRADRPGRIVLATEGNETAGEIARALPSLRARGVAVDVRPLTELPPGEVLVESVGAPARVYRGDTFLLDAVIYAQAPQKGVFTIYRGGEAVLEKEVDLLAGRNRVETAVNAGDAGTLLLEVAVQAPRDTFVENNKNGAIVTIAANPNVVVITQDLIVGEYFQRAIAVQGLTAKVITPTQAPKKLDDWLQYDSVVLMNVPALALDTTQQEQIEELVSVHGKGLFILGGETSFGPGGYFGTPFERMSPLSSRIPHETPKVALVFVLDRSGSMSAAADETARLTRLDVAKEATLTAVSLLNEDARVGIVVFDGEGYVLVPLQQQKDEAAIERALGPLIPGGGTFIYPGLELGVSMIERVDASAKHIVVMTDGLSQEANFAALIARAKAANISISAIAISSAADPRQPQAIAEAAGGHFYHTEDMRALPSILSQETLMLSSSPVKQVIARVNWENRDAAFLAGLPNTLPPVHAYIRTTAQPQADLHMTVTDDKGEKEPLMASWRYGNGKVLALATHGAGLGTEAWIDLPEYPLMWSQAIRHFLPDAKGPGVHVTIQRQGDDLQVAADLVATNGTPIVNQTVVATGPDGAITTLREVGGGHYEGAFTEVPAGAWRVEVKAGDLAGEAHTYIAYPARYDFARSDFDKLRALAGMSGGRLLPGEQSVFNDAMDWIAVPVWRLWAILALLLFLSDLTIRYAPTLFGLLRKSSDKRAAAAAAA